MVGCSRAFGGRESFSYQLLAFAGVNDRCLGKRSVLEIAIWGVLGFVGDQLLKSSGIASKPDHRVPGTTDNQFMESTDRLVTPPIKQLVPRIKMEATLHLLNAHLEAVRDQLKGDLQEELQKSLHDHTEGALPYTSHASLSSQSIDMLHEIEQLLEPGQLVLADHFLG